MACIFLKKIILGKQCIRNAYSVFRHLKSHIISDLDMMSRRYSLQTTHTRLLIKQQKLDCFAFFCETVRVNNKLLEKKNLNSKDDVENYRQRTPKELFFLKK